VGIVDDTQPAVDSRADIECEWRGCSARGDPWLDEGWCWWPRKYLWMAEGFYCPEHDAMIRQGVEMGAFDDWPLDTSPDVLEFQQVLAEFVPLFI
jgi:hypothetical protein